jgi:hypothetical protein
MVGWMTIIYIISLSLSLFVVAAAAVIVVIINVKAAFPVVVIYWLLLWLCRYRYGRQDGASERRTD